MKSVLVTGPAGFLGYHVIKLLNERGIRPRVLVEDPNPPPPDKKALTDKEFKKAMKSRMAFEAMTELNVDLAEGNVNEPASLQAACDGIDTVFHLKFAIELGDGADVKEKLHEVNVIGTRNLLDAAAAAGVARVVVSSSALTVGLNPEPVPLDETADWNTYRFDFPYAVSRREAETEALARPEGDAVPIVMAVNPSFTMGPEDFIGAPANGLIDKMSKRWFRFTAPIGFGVLDVRDYAQGALIAAEKGRHGQRYILSGDNVTPDRLLNAVAAVDGRRAPRWLVPISGWLVSLLIKGIGTVKGKRLQGAPGIVQLWGRNAWYNTDRARSELGWETRPLHTTLEDSLRWLRENAAG
jgi:dihydroflavonol-4-reductase